MVYITEDLIRCRAEHNDCKISSLEEVSLHQQNIEKIEHIDRWCPHLRLLYLHHNLIPRIENVGRLKKLEHLSLVYNNIEVIENLEGCESLRTLDLTLNFVGRLSSVASLKHNIHLQKLFLVGNPCTDFQGYRQYVVAMLPQLQQLDKTKISRSERIQASHGLDEVKRKIHNQEEEYLRRREKERNAEFGEDWKDSDFLETPCSFTPEFRLAEYRWLVENTKDEKRDREMKPKTPMTYITADGQVLNIDQLKLDYSLTEDDDNNTIILDLKMYRHLDTSLIKVDIQPTYVRVTVKGKILQLVLPAEVKPDSSTALRSQTTGHLVLTMPRDGGEIKVTKSTKAVPHLLRVSQNVARHSSTELQDDKRRRAEPEWLEVDPSTHSTVNLSNIVPQQVSKAGPQKMSPPELSSRCTGFSKGFVGDPDVPPLT